MHLLLADVLHYSGVANDLIAGKTYLAYSNDERLRLASQRCLSNVGEALFQAVRQRPDLNLYIADVHQAIALRHRLVHSYHNVADATCWSILQDDLPGLAGDVRDLLNDGLPEGDEESSGE